jgi:hypothetical protein
MSCSGSRHCPKPPIGTCLTCGRELCKGHVTETGCGRKGNKLHHMHQDRAAKAHLTCKSCGKDFAGANAQKRCPACDARHKEDRRLNLESYFHGQVPWQRGWAKK